MSKRESTQVGGRCYTKESSRNNVREINSRDAVTGYRGGRGTDTHKYRETEIEIGSDRQREGGGKTRTAD